MMSFIRKLFGAPKADIGALINAGATIVDVRTAKEYAMGNLHESRNIPLDSLAANLGTISRDKPVITCCASGVRSGIARKLLISKGYPEVYNGGSWVSLKKYRK